MASNAVAQENLQLKTKLQFMESELLKREKAINDLLIQQERAS